MSAPEPVAWMVEWNDGEIGCLSSLPAATLKGSYRSVTPLYPGPMTEEWGRQHLSDSGADAYEVREDALRAIACHGGRLMRRLVTPWDVLPRG